MATERGVLTEAVARAELASSAGALDCVEDDEARDEGRELRVPRVLELLGVGFEEQTLEVSLGDLARFDDQLPGVLICPRSPHALSL